METKEKKKQMEVLLVKNNGYCVLPQVCRPDLSILLCTVLDQGEEAKLWVLWFSSCLQWSMHVWAWAVWWGDRVGMEKVGKKLFLYNYNLIIII